MYLKIHQRIVSSKETASSCHMHKKKFEHAVLNKIKKQSIKIYLKYSSMSSMYKNVYLNNHEKDDVSFD